VIVRQPTQQVKLDHFDSPPTVDVNGALMTVIPSRFSRERFRSLVMDVYGRTGGVRLRPSQMIADMLDNEGHSRAGCDRTRGQSTGAVCVAAKLLAGLMQKNPRLDHESILHTRAPRVYLPMLSA
jgi:hypothetical protein